MERWQEGRFMNYKLRFREPRLHFFLDLITSTMLDFLVAYCNCSEWRPRHAVVPSIGARTPRIAEVVL